MNSEKKLYLYSGLAIVGAIIAYVIITKKKPNVNNSGDANGNTDPETNTTVSTTGEIIDNEQVLIPKTLSEILKKPSAQVTVALRNKPLYTKLDNVKVRNQNYVNNGIVNNIMSEITNSGFILGNILEVKDDKGGLKNPDGRVYKWFRVKPTQVTLDEMNRNKSFFTHVFLSNSTGREIYVREDTVKLEK